MRRLLSPPVAALILALLAWPLLHAQSADLLAEHGVDGSFESGGSGWTVSGADATFDAGGPVHAGSAAHLTVPDDAGAVVLVSQYWLAPRSRAPSTRCECGCTTMTR